MRFIVKNNNVSSQALINCPAITTQRELAAETVIYANLSVITTKKQKPHAGDRIIKDLESLRKFLSEWDSLTWEKKLQHWMHKEEPKEEPKVLFTSVSKLLVATFYHKPFDVNYSVWKGVGNTFFNDIDKDVMPEPFIGLHDIMYCEILHTINDSPYVHGEYTLESTSEGHYNLYKIDRWSINV